MPTSQAVFSLGKTARELGESISQRIVGERFSFFNGIMNNQVDKSALERFRRLVDNNQCYSDEQIIIARKLSLGLAPFLLEKVKRLLSFITRVKTIDAKARIVK